MELLEPLSRLPSSERYEFADFVLDAGRASLLRAGAEVSLRPKSFDLLHYLVAHPDRVLSKDELMSALWPRTVVTEDSLTRCISEVREALADRDQALIRTVTRRGYRFAAPVRRGPPAADPPAGREGHRRASDDPAAARAARPGGPVPPVGREAEMLALEALLRSQRLVTLLGPGGVGKSRLARWMLHRLASGFEHGTGWVDLANLQDAHLLAAGMAGALGLHAGGGEPLKGLARALQPLRLLVVLDNAEHLAAEVANVVEALHRDAPGITLLVTSQVPLKLAAESVYRLEPLASPPPDADVQEALRHGAVALLVQRITGVDARFELTSRNVAAAIEVCRKLDGLPLSIELAAARVPLFGLAGLSEALDERFRALTIALRESPARHRTLLAAMEWSHSLLGADEQTVFRRLSVFPGDFTLDTAQRVLECLESADETGRPPMDRWAVTDALGALVERSLVKAEGDDAPRYRLLETSRAFALECLKAAGEMLAVQRAHATATREALEHACADLMRGEQPVDAWRAACMAGLDDARAAWTWALQHDPDSAVSLAASLALVMASEWAHDRRRVFALTQPLVRDDMPAALRARWYLQAAFALGATQPGLAHGLAQQAVALHRELEDRLGLYLSLVILVYCQPATPEDDQRHEMEELREIELPTWPPVVRAEGAHAAACWHSARGDFEAAIEFNQRSLRLHGRAGSSWRVLVAKANLMNSQIAAGRIDDAIACGTALMAQLKGTRQLAGMPSVRLNLVAALLSKGDLPGARSHAIEGWSQALQLEWQPYWADYLALLCALEGRPRAAALLLGYAEAGYNQKEADREVNEARAAEQAEEAARSRLGPPTFEQLKRAGESLADDDVAELAFGTADSA